MRLLRSVRPRRFHRGDAARALRHRYRATAFCPGTVDTRWRRRDARLRRRRSAPACPRHRAADREGGAPSRADRRRRGAGFVVSLHPLVPRLADWRRTGIRRVHPGQSPPLSEAPRTFGRSRGARQRRNSEMAFPVSNVAFEGATSPAIPVLHCPEPADPCLRKNSTRPRSGGITHGPSCSVDHLTLDPGSRQIRDHQKRRACGELLSGRPDRHDRHSAPIGLDNPRAARLRERTGTRRPAHDVEVGGPGAAWKDEMETVPGPEVPKGQGRRQLVDPRATCGQRRQQPADVRARRPKPDVDVLGESGRPVKNGGLSADQEVFDPGALKAPEKSSHRGRHPDRGCAASGARSASSVARAKARPIRPDTGRLHR